jgi:hypothetical protein
LSAANRETINSNGGKANSDRDGLSFLATGADTIIEFEIIAHHGDARKHIGAIADESRPFDGAGYFAVFD